MDSRDSCRVHATHGREPELPGIGEKYSAEGGVTESARVLHDRFEDRLLIGRRVADHREDFARRRLLLERLR